jgi:siroheme synthase-like protein
MNQLPVMLNVRGKRAVIVGGGAVAARRAASLLEAGAKVTVIAPEMDGAMPVNEDLTRVRRGYEAGDLAGAMLVVVATSDGAVNEQVAKDGRAAGVLVNRADDPAGGDFTVPAHETMGPITVAVTTNGISARAAATIRDQMIAAIDPDWPILLRTVEPYRRIIQQNEPEASRRAAQLVRLTDEAAMRTLKIGGTSALLKHCRMIVQGD